jgi:hypothetical protein
LNDQPSDDSITASDAPHLATAQLTKKTVEARGMK